MERAQYEFTFTRSYKAKKPGQKEYFKVSSLTCYSYWDILLLNWVLVSKNCFIETKSVQQSKFLLNLVL